MLNKVGLMRAQVSLILMFFLYHHARRLVHILNHLSVHIGSCPLIYFESLGLNAGTSEW